MQPEVVRVIKNEVTGHVQVRIRVEQGDLLLRIAALRANLHLQAHDDIEVVIDFDEFKDIDAVTGLSVDLVSEMLNRWLREWKSDRYLALYNTTPLMLWFKARPAGLVELADL